MDPEQFQHLLNMLAGIQKCLWWLGFWIMVHAIASKPNLNSIEQGLKEIALVLGRKL